MIINNHINWIPKPIKPSWIFIFPTYILNDKSLTYWNGKHFDIVFKKDGKNGIGTINPDKRSAITTNIFTTPFSFIVNNVIIGYRVDKAIIKSDPINRDIIDKIKAFIDTGRDKPIGFGKKIVITIIGILLNNTLEYLWPNILKYHI